MRTVRFEFIALMMLVGWIAAAAGTLTSLVGIPVIPADAPVVIAREVVVPQTHASADVTIEVGLVAMVDAR